MKRVLKGILYLLLTLPVTLLALVLATCLAIIKLILPIPLLQHACTSILLFVAECWAAASCQIYRWLHASQWRVCGLENLSREQWYLLICNHQSWSDIPVLLFLLNKRIPVFRFFVKQQLLWVPLVGLACWAMEFPFMRRYSREQLRADPGLHGKDQQATQRFCERMKRHPATVVNYLEGTRFTKAKHDHQHSPYQHLLKPKSGGAAYVITHLGERVRQLIDVTIVYPGPKGFWSFLCGTLGAVVIHIQLRSVPEHLKRGDYQGSESFRQEFQQWIAELWQEKDDLIGQELGANQRRVNPK